MAAGKFLLISDYADGNNAAAGGAGVAIGDSYRALVDAQLRADIVTGFGAASAGAISLGGTDIREAGIKGVWRTVANPAARAALKDVLKRYDPATTVVILHQWTRYLSPAAIDLLRAFPLMVYLHDHFWACPTGAYYNFNSGQPCTRTPLGLACISANCDRGGRSHKAVRLVRHTARMLAARKPNAGRVFLHLSERARIVAGALLPGEQHEVIHNPFVGATDQQAAPPRQYDFGYFGRLEPEKGIRDLLAAMHGETLNGLFVGSGSLAPDIQRTAGATHIDWLPRDQTNSWMRKCAAITLPSRWPETWGLVTAEAMAAGVPVIVSSRAGSADLVQSFGGGVIFDPAAEGALKNALIAAASGQLAAGISAAQGARLWSLLSPATHAARLQALAYATWGIETGLGGSAATRASAREGRELVA